MTLRLSNACRTAAIVAAASFLAAATPAAAANADAMLILDASGSMWGQVDGQTKISAARAAVDKALQRLANDGDLRRVDRGLYDKPSTNALTGKPTPPLVRAVVDAVARRDNARLLVDGMTAANDLGLTTAVPSQVTVLTDARLKPIQLGAQTIRFKQAAPSRLYWAGHPAMRIVQALYWLKDVLPTDADVKRRLIDHLKQGQRSDPLIFDLWRGFAAMPIWMQTVVRDLFVGAGVDTLLIGFTHPGTDAPERIDVLRLRDGKAFEGHGTYPLALD